MNANSINDYLSMVGENADKLGIVGGEKIPKFYEKSPLFMVEMSQKLPKIWNEVDQDLIFAEDYLCLPFQSVKVIQKNKMFVRTEEEEMKTVSLAYCFSCMDNGEIEALCFNEHAHGVAFYGIHIHSQCLKNLWLGLEPGLNRQYLGACLKPKFFSYNNERDVSIVQANVQAALQMMLEFVSIVNCPRHFITRVRPNATHRSVEWINKKTHFIILSPEHARNVRSGHRAPLDGKITKAMHKRRAHFRTLKSEKYTHKKGFKIWVKATWVGPKEWIDTQNNSYLVLDRKL